MLKIQKITRYKLPDYPQGEFKQKPPDFLNSLIVKGLLPAAIVPLFHGCEQIEDIIGGGGKDAGGLVIEPELTEEDARPIIERVFAENNIRLDSNVVVEFAGLDSGTVQINLDGYNDSLRVGYEYLWYDDYDSLDTYTIHQTTDAALNDSGPYVKSIHAWYEDNADALDDFVQTFIDSLRSQGII